MFSQTGIYLTTFLFCSVTIAADAWDQRKLDSGFANWPGKNGTLKKGLKFLASDYAELNGYTINSDETSRAFSNFGIVRELTLVNGDKDAKIVIAVGDGSIANAHELLLRTELWNSQMLFANRWGRGDPNVQIGDFNFVGAGLAEVRTTIAFVRNNVTCVIIAPRAADINVATLAMAIDNKIQALPDLTVQEFNAKKPQIAQFAPANATIGPGQSTVLNITVADPSNEAIQHFVETNKLKVKKAGDVFSVSPSGYTGSIEITLTSVNESLLFKTGQASVTVTDP